MTYDGTYGNTADYFGGEPADILARYVTLIDDSGPVLDLGAGQGRNSLYLARKGYTVDAVDPSRVAIDTIAEITTREKLPIRVWCGGFETFVAQTEPHSAVLVFGLIQILSRHGIGLLLEKIDEWTSDGSLVFVTAFSTIDPSFERTAARWRQVDRNSFTNEAGEFHTYLEPDEIRQLFKNYTPVLHREGLGSMHRHGDRLPHQHGLVEAVFRK